MCIAYYLHDAFTNYIEDKRTDGNTNFRLLILLPKLKEVQKLTVLSWAVKQSL
jgi:hypothetical protein